MEIDVNKDRETRQKALQIVQEIIRRKDLHPALAAGVAGYTRNVEAELHGLDTLLSENPAKALETHKGAGQMLYSAVHSELQKGENLDVGTLTPEKVTGMLVAAYRNAAGS